MLHALAADRKLSNPESLTILILNLSPDFKYEIEVYEALGSAESNRRF